MKDLQGTFIFAVCLIAFTAVVFFFKYGQERAQSKVLAAESMAAQTMAMSIEQKAAEAEKRSAAARKIAEDNLKKAKEAREMLEKAKSQSALSQKEIVDKLNAQLEREADARIMAEKASAELAVQRDALVKAVEGTKQALENLKAQKAKSDSAEMSRLQAMLKDREAEIERLKKRAAELEQLRADAEAAQLKTETEIQSRGAEPTVAKQKLLLSPNIRRW